jgi:sugar lactone lactonase YvrE
VSGLDDPKGLAYWGGLLYVADLKGVYRIDRFGHPILVARTRDFPSEPILLNDLVATQDGTLYVSDTGDLKKGGGTVYKIDQSGSVTHALPEAELSNLQNPNGLLIEGKDRLLVADFVRGELHRIELASGETTPIARGLGGADGIVKTDEGQLYVSDWQGGEVFSIAQNGKVEPLGTADSFDAAADIRLSQDGNYLMVPDMRGGKLAFLLLH